MIEKIEHLYRKILRIRAQDSPNVRLAEAELSRGLPPSHDIVVPGVLPYAEYLKRRATWDAVRQSIGLDAEFWEGQETLLYPPLWLNKSEEAYDALVRANKHKRRATSIGVDPAEGGDKTAMAAGDELGVIEVVSHKTPDTSRVQGEVVAFGRKHQVPPENWIFDRGGGGKWVADRLRAAGLPVRTVGFGESVSPPIRKFTPALVTREGEAEERFAYLNRRAEMYGMLRLKLDPAVNDPVYAIPAEYTELRRQLSLMPLLYDEEGRMFLPPKRRRPGVDTHKKTLEEMLGCSPDESDALVLMVYGVFNKASRSKIRSAW